LDVIRKVGGVSDAMPLMTETTQYSLAKKSSPAMVWGVNENAKAIINLEPAYGRLISDEDVRRRGNVCVIDEKIAQEAYGRGNVTGKTMKLLINGGYTDFEIVGIAKSGINTLQSALSGIIPDFVYSPFTTAQDLTLRSGYDQIAVLLGAGDSGMSDSNAVSEQIKADLELKNARTDISAMNLLSQKKGLENVLGTVTMILSLIAGISLIVAGISVMTAMLVSVNERRREIGIKKSVGALNIQIMGEFLKESVSLSARGTLYGVISGVACAAVGCWFAGFPITVDSTAILCSVSAAVIMGGLFGVYPAAKAANLPPVEALRG
jgi:putative ABC transport system permease protein